MHDQISQRAPSTQSPFQRLYWTPAVLLVVGFASFTALIWANAMKERQGADFSVCNAVKDIRIATGTAHREIEEVIYEDTSMDLEKAFGEIDLAIGLAESVLRGGRREQGQFVQPLKNPRLRGEVEDLHSLLVSFKATAIERLQDPNLPQTSPALSDRFHGVFKKIQDKADAVDDELQRDQIRTQAGTRRLFAGVLLAWMVLVIGAAAGLLNRQKHRRRAEEALRVANAQLLEQAEALTQHRERLAQSVEERTAELRASNELLRHEIVERRQSEGSLRETQEQIRQLSGRLIDAQETERRRISAALHDELGQALNVMKLEIRVIEERLKGDQGLLKEDCRRLADYVGVVLEDLRRLSLDLSPTLLEDFGLKSAFEWLVGNLAKTSTMGAATFIPDIDEYLPENHKIVIYRVIQETLANVVKHARAKNLVIVAQHHDDKVTFVVEDDGAGFSPAQAIARAVSERRLGLTTMRERVSMIGGAFDLWSEEQKGTRITFSVPAKKGSALE